MSCLLPDRTFRSVTILRPRSLPLTTIRSRPPVYKEYYEEQICRAYEAVQEGASVRHAAEQYGIASLVKLNLELIVNMNGTCEVRKRKNLSV